MMDNKEQGKAPTSIPEREEEFLDQNLRNEINFFKSNFPKRRS
jgi:hypothetical protein